MQHLKADLRPWTSESPTEGSRTIDLRPADGRRSELEQLLSVLGRWKISYPARAEWPRTGGQGEPCFLMSGWACRVYELPSEGRQVLSLLVPGDVVSYAGSAASLPWSTTIALTPVTVMGPHPAATPEPARAMLAERVRDLAESEHAWLCLHTVRLSRLSAYARTIHLLLELLARLKAAGLAEGYEYRLPLVQDVMADLLGMSVTHLNRILQQLRREERIEFRRGKVRLLDPEGLAALADFRPPIGPGAGMSRAPAFAAARPLAGRRVLDA